MTQDGIILLHGIARSKRSMARLARVFAKSGMRVLNLDYPSRTHDIAKLATVLQPEMAAFAANVPGKVHFIGHSMGGLIIRAVLTAHRPENLGRVVMLGPPNQGSEVADAFSRLRLYRKFFGPAGQQLVTNQADFSAMLGVVDYSLGIIAGARTIDPISSWIIGQESDGKVAVERTKCEGMAAHITLPVSHTFLPLNRRAIAQTQAFIESGAFLAL